MSASKSWSIFNSSLSNQNLSIFTQKIMSVLELPTDIPFNFLCHIWYKFLLLIAWYICCNFEELSFFLNWKYLQSKVHFFTYNCTCGFINSFKVPVLELSWSCGLKPDKNTKKGLLVNSRIQWFYCIKMPWAFLNFIFHSEHASTDGARAKLRSCLDLWWEKHSFEYCLKLRRWVHIGEDTLTEFCFVLFTVLY